MSSVQKERDLDAGIHSHCGRQHKDDEACPKRVAYALIWVTHGTSSNDVSVALSPDEKVWFRELLASLTHNSVVPVIEEILATEGDFKRYL